MICSTMFTFATHSICFPKELSSVKCTSCFSRSAAPLGIRVMRVGFGMRDFLSVASVRTATVAGWCRAVTRLCAPCSPSPGSNIAQPRNKVDDGVAIREVVAGPHQVDGEEAAARPQVRNCSLRAGVSDLINSDRPTINDGYDIRAFHGPSLRAWAEPVTSKKQGKLS